MLKHSWIFLLVFVGLGSADEPGREWTRFRGPNGTGIGWAEHVPVKWTEKY